jgi:hypothetical protein
VRLRFRRNGRHDDGHDQSYVFARRILARAGDWPFGPSLLILTGVATVVRSKNRLALYIEASIILLIGLAAWSVPKIGWQGAGWLFLYPEAASLLGAIVILLIVRKAWAGALVGAILSAPFFVYTGMTLLQGHIRGTLAYTIEDVSVAVPLVLLLLSLIFSLRLRAD